MLCVDDLLSLELFQKLPKNRLDWVCARAQAIEVASGEVLVREGDPPRGFYLFLSGRIGVTRQSEGVDMPVGQHEAPGFFGEIPVLTDEPVPVTFRALTDCLIYELSSGDFRELLYSCRDFERVVFRAVQRRSRGLESFVRSREKMAALGTLAAGLAHELNNPAAAIVRIMQNVIPALTELQHMTFVYAESNTEAEHTQQWLQVRDDGYNTILHDGLKPNALSKQEEQLLEWLEAYGVDKAWELAAPLAAGGVAVETLILLTKRWQDDPTELRDLGLRWLAQSFDIVQMVASGLRGAERISELIQSMKSYSYMDQGAQQFVDVHEGLEDTLRLLSYKLKQGIEVRRLYSRSLPHLSVYGSELNQVWTYLLDNATDAILKTGIIEIATSCDGDHIQVQITDSGSGIPTEIQSRVFEPFFTTKPVGKGSGLGLDVVRRIVENRHKGTITFASKPGKTTFSVCLPLKN